MGLSINQNIMAMNSYRNLSSTQNSLAKSLEKLSSGFRINRAADDAAGLAISEGLRSQVRGNKQAVRNAQDGISVVQTAEGALDSVHSILQRQRELAVQAANDSNNGEARNNIKAEMMQLTDELSRIADATNFNGTHLLDGTAGDNADGKLMFQVGANGDKANHIQVDLAEANVKDVAQALAGAKQTDGTALKREWEAAANSGAALAAGDTVTVTIGGTTKTYNLVDDSATGLKPGDIKVQDFTAAKLKTDFDNKYEFVVGAADAKWKVTAAAGGTDRNGISISVNGNNVVAGTDKTGTSLKGDMQFDMAKGISVANHDSAQKSIALIDAQIKKISTARANLGAVQNRFEYTINNLNTAVENLSASESRIRDTDMAQEMMQFTRNNILSQAGTSMLAQANQATQGVLSLLR